MPAHPFPSSTHATPPASPSNVLDAPSTAVLASPTQRLAFLLATPLVLPTATPQDAHAMTDSSDLAPVAPHLLARAPPPQHLNPSLQSSSPASLRPSPTPNPPALPTPLHSTLHLDRLLLLLLSIPFAHCPPPHSVPRDLESPLKTLMNNGCAPFCTLTPPLLSFPFTTTDNSGPSTLRTFCMYSLPRGG